MGGTGHLYRLVVTYGVGTEGELVPLAPPLRRVRVGREGFLYQQLANLADADVGTLAQAATRHGPLGPTSEVGTPGDARRLAWATGELFSFLAGGVGELQHWIAAGGGIAVGIPGRLSPTAHLLVACAEMNDELLARSIWAEDQLADGTGERLSDPERLHFRTILWDEILAAIADYARMVDEIAADVAQDDKPVHVRAPAGITADRLQLAAKFVQSVFSGLGHEGGAAAVIEPGGLASMAMLLGQYESDPPRGVPDTVEAWHRAAAELVVWKEAMRLLRAVAAGRDVVADLEAVLAKLRRYAGLDSADAPPLPSSHPTDLDTLRAATAGLLTLRLQQVHAWPLPGEQEVVGAFGRALWSLWRPITGSRPRVRCQWRGGCSRWLPDDAHGNRRYCREHQEQAPRDRAARSRLRRRQPPGSGSTLGGSP